MRTEEYLLSLIILFISCFQVAYPFSLSSDRNGTNGERHVSAAQRARRDEEMRRKERISEAVPGKTSAIAGAKDFEINVKRTEMEWDVHATGSEREVKVLTLKGLDAIKMLRLDEANKAFDSVFRMKPDAYCWQAGIAKFYIGDYYKAAECFARNAHYYEKRFEQVASEERIWRDACELKLLSEAKSKRQNTLDSPIAQISTLDIDGPNESRKVIKIAGDLFRASVDNDLSAMTLARAKLRSICGEYDGNLSIKKIDLKMWRLSSWFYLALHYDVMGDSSSSKDCMKMAMRQCIVGNGNDIIQTLPMLHMAQRDWFDDDDFVEDVGLDEDEADFDLGITSNADAIQSIEDSVKDMKLSQLQNSLKLRGQKSSGSKSVVRERLIRYLVEDAGLN